MQSRNITPSLPAVEAYYNGLKVSLLALLISEWLFSALGALPRVHQLSRCHILDVWWREEFGHHVAMLLGHWITFPSIKSFQPVKYQMSYVLGKRTVIIELFYATKCVRTRGMWTLSHANISSMILRLLDLKHVFQEILSCILDCRGWRANLIRLSDGFTTCIMK